MSRSCRFPHSPGPLSPVLLHRSGLLERYAGSPQHASLERNLRSMELLPLGPQRQPQRPCPENVRKTFVASHRSKKRFDPHRSCQRRQFRIVHSLPLLHTLQSCALFAPRLPNRRSVVGIAGWRRLEARPSLDRERLGGLPPSSCPQAAFYSRTDGHARGRGVSLKNPANVAAAFLVWSSTPTGETQHISGSLDLDGPGLG